jgi:hypothetical protein
MDYKKKYRHATKAQEQCLVNSKINNKYTIIGGLLDEGF